MCESIEQKVCLECGAPEQERLNCWGQLGALIAWEYDDPELLAEHFKTVASYNLQHPAMFQDNALEGLRQVFCEHLDHGLPISEIRKRIGKLGEGTNRVLKKENERTPFLRHWPMTIDKVFIPGHPDGAAQRVRDWAKSIRNDL
ncbi:MAG: hypothetical protein K0R18_1521 [Bacillales bacterium]|jgi:hypothetical protein|nr:hypothetical protein [Bacillales bacterium]